MLRDDLLHICQAALRAVDPRQAVMRSLYREGAEVWAGQAIWSTQERVLLVAAGKAAATMAEAAAHILGDRLTEGIVVTRYGHAEGCALPPSLRLVEAGHPLPDEAGLQGARRVADLLATTTAQDAVLVLLSGGASALLPLPADGLTLAHLQKTTDLLLRAGATIREINAVRKHLSAIKGGLLARMAAPASVVALVLSDVVGDPLDVIASGPTVPDPTTYADALAVLTRYALLERVPSAVRAHLEAGARGERAETPKPGERLFTRVHNAIIGSNRVAARAAVKAAEMRGYRTMLLSTFVEGEAREVGKVVAALAKSVHRYGDPLSPPACLVLGGETTVTVRGQGKGGRNQELALAAALALEGMSGVALMTLATDGSDGPTDAAGAIVDGETIVRARHLGWDAHAALADNNAYPLLDAVGALLRTGPTGTNVNDLTVLLVAD